MIEKLIDEMSDAREIVYSANNSHCSIFCTINVFDVEESEEEIFIYGDEKSRAEISLSKTPDKIFKEDEGWLLKYGSEYVSVSVIR